MNEFHAARIEIGAAAAATVGLARVMAAVSKRKSCRSPIGGADGGHSVPTRINADKMHFATLRLDYSLASSALLEAARACGSEVKATLLRDDRSTTLSDHFPLEVAFYEAPHRAESQGDG